MGDMINLKNRVLNQPLLLEPSYAQVLMGALADKLSLTGLTTTEGVVLDAEQLKDGAYGFSNDHRGNKKPYEIRGTSAIIPVMGSLVAKSGYLDSMSGVTSYEKIKSMFDMAMQDDDVEDIVMQIDSPGGEVNGCFELCDYIHKARGDKNLTALVGGMACSAAYAIASSCDKIIISATSSVGSIGVVTAHQSMEKHLADQGIKVTLITSGKHKGDGNPYVDLPDDVRDRIQSRLEKIHTMFAEQVSMNRGMTVKDVFATEALTYMGSDAIDMHLADEVVSTIDFLSNLSQNRGSNINMESNMTDKKNAEAAPIAADATALAAAKAQGVEQGSAEMQTRIQTILACDEAEGRKDLASHLAFKTTMNADDAVSMLAVAAKEPTVAAAAPGESAALFQQAVVEASAEPIGADSAASTIVSEEDPAFALAAFKQLNG